MQIPPIHQPFADRSEQSSLKLSEAIRKGASMGYEQGIEFYFDARKNTVCALGAAHIGDGGRYGSILFASYLIDRFPVLGEYVEWPHDETLYGGVRKLLDQITILNDKVGWTFEEIADWVESLGY
jgi:hypothetical protein